MRISAMPVFPSVARRRASLLQRLVRFRVIFSVVFGFTCFGPAWSKPLTKPAKSDHYDGERFFNPGIGVIDKSYGDLLKWKFGGTAAEWPEQVEIKAGAAAAPKNAQGVAATFVNHATFVLRFGSANGNVVTVLTDPIWSERCSPVSFAGPKRVHAPGVPFDSLPRIDVVVVSHNHYDHLDLPTLRRLAARDNPLFLVPLGNKALMQDDGITRVEEMDWWQTKKAAGIAFTFLPSQHWSSRTPFDRNETLWGSWGMKGADGTRVYHAGDTGYGPHFKSIRERWGAPDLALLPIGSYDPEWFMKIAHMNPEDAVRAYHDLAARQAVGMHFGTFQLTDEARDEPGIRTRKAASGLPFYVPAPGQGFLVAPE
jgi:L-ascorbate metabolism protein UlaG (beta-lactamase superfamily)